MPSSNSMRLDTMFIPSASKTIGHFAFFNTCATKTSVSSFISIPQPTTILSAQSNSGKSELTQPIENVLSLFSAKGKNKDSHSCDAYGT